MGNQEYMSREGNSGCVESLTVGDTCSSVGCASAVSGVEGAEGGVEGLCGSV